jgi:hypothetical protein
MLIFNCLNVDFFADLNRKTRFYFSKTARKTRIKLLTLKRSLFAIIQKRTKQHFFIGYFSVGKKIFATTELSCACFRLMLRPTSRLSVCGRSITTPPSIEILSMLRLMSPVLGALLVCAQSLPAMAADSSSVANTVNSEHQLREQIEAKRDQLSGAANLGPATQTIPGNMLDAPVATDDAPAQAQQP